MPGDPRVCGCSLFLTWATALAPFVIELDMLPARH
jgi:hypothetical protein